MKKIGLCVTGSFCTFSNLLTAVDALVDAGYEIVPVFSYNVSTLDTRFFKQADFEKYIVEKTGKTPIKTIVEAETITKSGIELMLVAPCTGNTLAKIVNGITDTPTTMAVKATLRTNKPVVLSISSTTHWRKRQKRRDCTQHQKLISRTFRSRRAGQQTALFDCGRLSHLANDRKSIKPRANPTGNTLICRTIAVSIKNNGFRIVKSVVFCCKIDKIATFV